MRRITILLLIATIASSVLFIPLAGFGEKKPEFTFRFGGSDSIGALLDRTNRKFIELVEAKSQGRIKFKFYPADMLGGDIAQIEQMMADSIQFYGDVLDWWANWVKDFAITGWGFTFRDYEHFRKFIDSSLYMEMREKLRKEFGLRILAAAPTGLRVMFSKKPVHKLEDIQGIKMRVPEILAYLRVWEALGTRPTRVTWAEVYLALKTGVIDACEGPVMAAYGAKMHEPTRHVIRTDHLISTAHVTMNEKTWQKLPPDLQKIVEEAAKEAVNWASSVADKEMEETFKKMEAEGATIIKIDTGPWRERLIAAVEKVEAEGLWSKGLWKKIQEIK